MSRYIFSIVIPTYRRYKQLFTCLDSLSKLRYPKDKFEVVIVNDEKCGSLYSMIDIYRKICNVKFCSQYHSGPAAARNYGASFAQGEILSFTDDDCTVSDEWLFHLESCLTKNSPCAVGGSVINATVGNHYALVSQIIYDYLVRFYNSNYSDANFLFSGNIALPKDMFESIGGFSRLFPYPGGEDREFCDRLKSKGFRLVYCPDAIVYHDHNMNFKSFLSQHINYGKGSYRYRRSSSKINQKFHVHKPSILKELSIHLIKNLNRIEDIYHLNLFICSQAASLLGYILESRNEINIDLLKVDL